MSYKLTFKKQALKEWKKLAPPVQAQFKKKLQERLEAPRVESCRLNGMDDCYKIKLQSAGFRLVYQVKDNELIVTVVAVGKRERNQVYQIAKKRI